MAKQAQTPDHDRNGTANARPQPKDNMLETAVVTHAPSLLQTTADPGALTPAHARTLQRTLGNQALGRLTLQRKMTLGPVGDAYEQEADAVAKQVVSNLHAPQKTQRQEEEDELQMKPEISGQWSVVSGQLPSISRLQRQEEEEEVQMKPLLQRQEEEEDLQMMPFAQRQEEEEEIQTKRTTNLHSSLFNLQRQEEEEEVQMKPLPVLQRHPGHEEEAQMSPLAQRHEEEEELQMKSGETAQRQTGEISPDIESAIQNGRSGGQPLSDPIRQPMEQAFNADFSGVRIHTGSQSDALNRSISARAFTTGQDVFFRTGEYNPDSSSGKELLAHELTHTIQQGAAPQYTAVQAKRVEGKTAVKKQADPHKIQRVDTQHSLAKIINAGVTVSNARGNLGQLGHAMDVWVEIDAGTHPTTPANAKPNSVYGLEFEYWEYVDVPHDNQGAIGVKPWNDIHGIKPDASTFDTPAAGCALTWKAAVAEAAAGTLTGRKKIGFRDIPGLFEKVGRDVERTLQFRIVFNDGATRKDIFATQLLRVNGGHLGYSAYTDSVGNTIESHGFGGGGYKAGSEQETAALGLEGSRLATDGSALPSAATIRATIPQEAKVAVQTFVKNLVDNTADPFIDREMVEFVSKVPSDKQAKQAPKDWVDSISKHFMTDKPGVAAGQYLIPNIPGTQRKQTTLPSGAILVALVTGNNILRMYYSDNTVQNVSMNIVPQLATRNWNINLRSFTEIPTEMVQSSLDIYRSTSVVTTLKDAPLNADNAHLRKFVKQGNHHIVKVNDQTGARIKRNKNVSIYTPEVRDITGAWVKAKFGDTIGFIRADKITGTKEATAWNKEQKGELPEIKPDQAMVANDEVHLKQLAQAHVGNHAALLNNILVYMRTFPGRVESIEQVYNSEVPKLGIAVPATLGNLAHNHFVREFENRGNGTAVYQNLNTLYPEFQYLLKPAYRLVFGEAQLKIMLQQIRTDEFAAEVPDPDGLDNQMEKLDFLLGGPYTLTNHTPSTGIGKFDAEYDPMMDELKIIVKLSFDFVDLTDPYESVTVPAKPVDPGYLRKQWEDTAKQPWIAEFKRQIDSIWNGKFTLQCVRPGWANVRAVPVMEVREVPLGQQHFKVKVDKAALVNDSGQEKMRTQGGSSNVDSVKWEAQLREFDLVDKISDPAVHEYLHAGEKKGNITPAYKLDRERLENMLKPFSQIAFQANSTTLANPRIMMNLIDAIKRTEIPSTLSHLHPIILEKNLAPGPHERPNWRLAALRAQQIEDQLRLAGIRNPIQVTLGGQHFDGLVAKIGLPDPLIENTYVQNWQRISAAHEFGHMVGLVDEYNPAASTEMVKKMISDGLLPPETPGNHLSSAGQGKSSGQGAKQSAFAKLLDDTNQSAPDFTYDKGVPMSTSLMTGGYEVMAQHFVTFWEALTTMTQPYVDKKYWEIR